MSRLMKASVGALACAVVAFYLSAAVPTDGGAWAIGSGETETLDAAATISELQNNGSLTLGAGAALGPRAALLPGVSRSGSTISAALLCGVSQKKAVAFSFLLGIPAVLAAGALTFAECAAQGVAVDWPPLVCGGATAAVVGVFSIRLIEKLVQKNRFRCFGYYCLAAGATVILVSLLECYLYS